MNYIRQMNGFRTRRGQCGCLSPVAQALWLVLTMEQNALNWPLTFCMSSGYVCHLLGDVSEKVLRRARGELVETGLLGFVPGGQSGKDVSQYTMTQLYEEDPLTKKAPLKRPRTAPLTEAPAAVDGGAAAPSKPKEKTINENINEKRGPNHASRDYGRDVAGANRKSGAPLSGGLGAAGAGAGHAAAGDGRQRSGVVDWGNERNKPL